MNLRELPAQQVHVAAPVVGDRGEDSGIDA